MSFAQMNMSAGMLIFFIISLTIQIKSSRRLRFALPHGKSDFWDKWLIEHKIDRTIRILVSDQIATPVTAGVLRPRILLLKSINLSDAQLLLAFRIYVSFVGK